MDKQELLSCLQSFEMLCCFIESNEPETILRIVSSVFAINSNELANCPMGGYSRVMNNGSFSRGSGCYRFVLAYLKQHLDEAIAKPSASECGIAA